MKEIILTKGYRAIVDDADYELFNIYNWHATISCKDKVYAARKDVLGKTEYLHRRIMQAPDDCLVDHLNHNTLDNRKDNLRLACKSLNALNSKAKGVTELANGSFRAQLRVKGVYYNKCFRTYDEARAFYIETKKKVAGV